MKKAIIITALVMFVACGVSLASVGIKVNDAPVGIATDINFPTGTTVTTDGSTYSVTQTTSGLVGAITSGTINGATIGASSASTGKFTTLVASGNIGLGTTLATNKLSVDPSIYSATAGSGGNRTLCVSADGKVFSSATACP
jgi:hypothetical protein